jgi:signal transduction histidine kinase
VGQGTGLGLPICRNIVHNLGGEISFESKAGQGCTFKVRIPVS